MTNSLSGADGAQYYNLTMPDGSTVSCNDVIDALGLSFGKGEAFKALWRMGRKPGTPALYDAEKVVYFAERELARLRRDEPVLPLDDDGWIKHTGMFMPVDPELNVTVRLKDGTEDRSLAKYWAWDVSEDRPGRIIAYRLAA